MNVTIDWPTKVIFVPKSELTLIQSNPVEIREMNLNSFRLALKDKEDDEVGMVFPDTHRHNTEVTLGSLTFARVIEIINGYTVTFEDGQYAVNLIGANSNVGDVVNVNQVSVRSYNSAGLISSPMIEHISFGGMVHIDPLNITGRAGSDLGPRGSSLAPVTNMVDALEVGAYRGLTELFFYSNATINAGLDYNGYRFRGYNKLAVTLTIQPTAVVEQCWFVDLRLQGTLDDNCYVMDCIIDDLLYVNGDIHGCEIQGVLTIGGTNGLEIWNSYSGRQGPADPTVIDMNGVNASVAIHNFSGHIKIRNMTQGVLGLSTQGSAHVKVENTCTGGMIHIMGNCKVIDQHTGTCSVRTSYVTSPIGINTYLTAQHGSGNWTTGPAAPTVSEIDTQLSSSHGSGAWNGAGNSTPEEIATAVWADATATEVRSSLARLLGLTHENAFIDNTTYDDDNQLLTARVRIYDSKAHVEAATDGGSESAGLLASYLVETTYLGVGMMGTYRMKRSA